MKNKDFGSRLRELREGVGAGLRGLAADAQMDPAYLSRIETGTTRPKRETVERLASALCLQEEVSEEGCREIRRILMEAGGHMRPEEEIFDDLEARFAAMLRATGKLGEAAIDSALDQVGLGTMRRVLRGEEDLEIGNPAQYTAEELERRRGAGEEVHALFRFGPSGQGSRVEEPAASYVAKVEGEFKAESRSGRKPDLLGRPRKPNKPFATRRSTTARPSKPTRIGAGPEAEIVISRRVSPQKREQLKTIARLIASLMQEEREETEESHD